MNETLARRAARARVEQIREDLGFPRREIWDTLNEVQRQEWTRILQIKDKIIASSVKTLAKNLYTSKARFVFELLQNAEDNQYEEARRRGEVPSVSFHVYPDKIIQECNEDGFTDANLRAICAVGQSSKHGAQGYVGEKGIGFKSVFMAAYRVHIQSRGGLSFSFENRMSDSGLGMITPHWQDPQDDLGDQLTRITLLLHDEGDEDELARQRRLIREQFAEIHDTILLFLKKLSNIVVVFHDNEDDEAEVTKSITFAINRGEADRRVLTRKTTEGGNTTEVIKHYHITRQLVNNLAGNENRVYTDAETASRAYASSEVTLAFPLTAGHVPVLNDEWVFAFLPVQKTRFKFLIQADFVTQANRQGIVVDSARNKGLCDGIADAFITGIKQMCRHPTLRFQWMRYLPKPSDTIDNYWLRLITQIGGKLRETEVMVPSVLRLFGSSLKLIRESKMHAHRELDNSGKPLLRDIEPRVYLSSDYLQSDLELLATHGLDYTSMTEIIDRARWDLSQTDSRIKSVEDQDWQSRTAKLLRLPFTLNHLRSSQNEIKVLELLPLRTGQWRRKALFGGRPVYYPKVAGTDMDIPDKLALDVICPSAMANKDRKELFDSVGVTNASVATVRSALMAFYREAAWSMSLIVSANHVWFFYLTHHHAEAPPDYGVVQMMWHEHQFMNFKQCGDAYIRDDSPYGPGELLEPTPAGNQLGDGAPGLEVRYVNKYYLQNAPSPPTSNTETFKNWLHEQFNVRRYIPIADAEGKNLSEACRYIATHRPEKFLGFLKEAWGSESGRFRHEGDVLTQLKEINVLCDRGGETRMHCLKDVYLPLDTLRELCDRFLLDEDFFPFLKLETPLSNGRLPLEWEEMDAVFTFGVNNLDLIDFTLFLLKTIRSNSDDPSSLDTPKRLLDIYVFLQGQILASGNQGATKDKVKSFFNSGNNYIYVPQNGSRDAKWASPKDCVWQAPTGAKMMTQNSLSHLYSYHFRSEAGQLNTFFKTVGVHQKCAWENIVDEIKALKAEEYSDLDITHTLYEYLDSLNLIAISKQKLRDAFANEKLIYGGEVNKWYTTTECLWSSPTEIRAMLIVQPLYEDLEDFFVAFLGIETKTADMVYEKLKSGDTAQLTMEEIKNTILAFSSLLSFGHSTFDPAPVLRNKVFPVRLPRSGEQVIRSGNDAFAIWDLKPLGDAFSDQAIFLDFGMDLVRDLEHFIRWAGLEDRYLSNAVKDISSVDSSSTRPVSSRNLFVQSKAHALVRIAVTYKSPRVGNAEREEALYHYLRGSETLETSKITSELHLYQDDELLDDKLLRVEKEAALLHIREDTLGLKIYVPKNKVHQETCFRSKLPQRLCEWLMTNPESLIVDPVSTKAVMVVQGILGARHRSLPAILDEHGILDIAMVDEEEDDGADDDDDDDAAGMVSPMARISMNDPYYGERSPSRTLTSDHSVAEMTPPSSTISPYRHESSDDEGATFFAPNARVRVLGSVASSAPRPIPVQPSQSGYTRLLTRIVAQARQGVFPTPAGPLNIPGYLRHEVDGRDPYGLQAFGKLQRDKMVGAAGELFVFELLSCLRNPALPGFTIDNWQSTIRHYVASHPEYGDIEQLFGPETSDIKYDDIDGVLTNLLINKGYIPAHVGAAEQIKYSIEVKTTTDVCEAPFYMSKAQYNMMQRQYVDNDFLQPPDKLYVIFRVYNIGRGSIGMQVLVNPEHMRRAGTLDFTVDNWSVVIRN